MSAPYPAPGTMDSHTEIAAGLGQHIAGEIRRRLPEYAERMRNGPESGASAAFAVYVNLGWESHGQCMVAHINIVGDPKDLRLPLRFDAGGDLQLIPQEEAQAIEAAAQLQAQPPMPQQAQQPQQAMVAPPQYAPVSAQPQPLPLPPQPIAAPLVEQQFAQLAPPPQMQQTVAPQVMAVPPPPPYVLPGQSNAPGARVKMSNDGYQTNPGKINRRQLAGD